MLKLEGSPFRPLCAGSGGISDSSESDNLALLPRHTKVMVTGNNRTKSVLVGLKGVVKKAVGLGGWHWLVLTNGVEVKLQRNALSVLEVPTGDELDQDDYSDEDRQSSKSEIAEEFQRPFKPRARMMLKQNSCCAKSALITQPFDLSSSESESASLQKVDFRKLEAAVLERYARHFNLVETGTNPLKEELADAVERHFTSQQRLDELQVIASFVQAAKRLKTVYC